MLSRFHTILEPDGRTDKRQTDGRKEMAQLIVTAIHECVPMPNLVKIALTVHLRVYVQFHLFVPTIVAYRSRSLSLASSVADLTADRRIFQQSIFTSDEKAEMETVDALTDIII